MVQNWTRRTVLGSGAGLLMAGAGVQAEPAKLRTRPIPHGKGEQLPVVGVGTSEVFEVGPTERAGPAAVVQALKSP